MKDKYLDEMVNMIAEAEGAWKAGYLTWDEYEKFVFAIQMITSYRKSKPITIRKECVNGKLKGVL